jgi:phosphatidylglycerophosphate synthase
MFVSASPEYNDAPVLCFVGTSSLRLWSLTPTERLVRQFAREGVAKIVSAGDAVLHQGPIIYVRADAIIDQPLIPVLIKRPNLLLLGESTDGPARLAAHVQGEAASAVLAMLAGGHPPATNLALIESSPRDLGADFWKALRKRETPYAYLLSKDNQQAVEWRMFMGTYKGATDLVTKHLWPLPAFYATGRLASLGITPNMVTVTAAMLVFLAFWLFLNGHFGWGLAAAWFMTFLDTVDGKLARSTLTSSKWGDVLDHGLDLIHPPFWYVAWGLGLPSAGFGWPPNLFWSVIGAILGGYILQRVIEGVAIKWLGLEIHIWRPIDTLFRQVTARRNPNLLILTLMTIFGRPDLGLIAVAVWTLICLALHAVQLAQALIARRRGPLISWMATRP